VKVAARSILQDFKTAATFEFCKGLLIVLIKPQSSYFNRN